MLGVLVTAGAAICLAPCGSALAEWNPGQAINAVTGTRLWAFVFSLPGTVLILALLFCFTRLPPASLGCCCATVRTLLRSPRGDAAAPPAFSPWPRWLASFHSCLPVPPASAPSAADRSPHRMVPECVALLAPHLPRLIGISRASSGSARNRLLKFNCSSS